MSLSIEPTLEAVEYYFQASNVDGHVLLRSTNWETRAEAESAYWRFLPLAIEETNYVLDYNNNKCEYSFKVADQSSTGSKDWIASHPHQYKLPRLRDEQIQVVLNLLREQIFKEKIHPGVISKGGFVFALKLGDFELNGESCFPYPSEAELAFTRLLSQMTNEEAIYSFEQSENDLRLVVSDSQEKIRAVSGPSDMAALERMRDLLVEHATQITPMAGTNLVKVPVAHCQIQNTMGEGIFDSWDILDPTQANIECNGLLSHILDDDNFRHIESEQSNLFGFELVSPSPAENVKKSVRHPTFFQTESERDDFIQALRSIANTEGLHLVEHILLRPLQAHADETFLSLREVVRGNDGKLSMVGADNYSFVATVVIPGWPVRSQDMSFRRFFEKTIRMETPAHVFLRIKWVSIPQMREFESAFKKWLESTFASSKAPDQLEKREDARRELVDILNKLRNVTARLASGTDVDHPVILGQTPLETGATHDFS